MKSIVATLPCFSIFRHDEVGPPSSARPRLTACGRDRVGDHSAHSDLDLVIADADTTDRYALAELKDDIMESDFPYLCDVFYLEEIANPSLLEHIKNDGKILYEKRQ